MSNQTLPVTRAAEIEQTPAVQPWLIHTIWGKAAVGLISGHPKLGKTWMGLDLAVSVASGTPCLGCFQVEQAGKVLIFLAEDSLPAVRSRIESLCAHRNIDIRGLDLYVITAAQLQLQMDSHAEALRQTVAQLRPSLLLLDPLVRLHSLDENRSYEMSRLLDYFRAIQRDFDVAVILVHHAGKKTRSHPGQAMRGTGDFWAWSDSSIYLTRKNDHIELVTEHRFAAATEPVALRFCSGKGGSATHLEVIGDAKAAPTQPTLPQRIVQALYDQPNPVRRKTLRAKLRINNQRLGEALTQLEQQGLIRRDSRGWVLRHIQHNIPARVAASSTGKSPTAASTDATKNLSFPF